VRLDEPSWWYRTPASTSARCLQPLAALYGWAARLRYGGTEAYRSRLPVVCIGNFTVGGTGKTPLVMHICQHMAAAGPRPAALTRGYGGRLAGPHWVDGHHDRAGDVGDEALLLASAAPTLLARDRRAGAQAIEHMPAQSNALAHTMIVMDDGLQNSSLRKDLAIAVVDGVRGIGNGLVLPAGPLRAPLAFQLALTDAIIVNEGVGDADGHVAAWLRQTFHGPVLRSTVRPAEDTQWLQDRRVIAWAGIGAPQRFFALLQRCGAVVVDRVAFGDHHNLSAAEAERLMALCQHHEASLVTTQKDLARLRGATGPCLRLAELSRALPIKVEINPSDALRLAELLNWTAKPR
jgi:tetraacyldisaccharide 4'-kinase